MIGLIKKFIAVTLAVSMQLPIASLALAQSTPDIRSPVIELSVIAESVADDTQVFQAQINEDKLLRDVLLYHRRAGQQPFTPIAMVQVGISNNYSATLVTDPEDLRAIEYYVQARDDGGNRTVEGFAFDPYTRVLIAGDTVVNTPLATTTTTAEPTTTTAEPTTSTATSKIRWWHVVAGVVVVGALASLAGGDSNDGSSADDNTVPLTVTTTGPVP